MFQPENPNFESRTRDSFARQPFMNTLGAKLGKIGPGSVEIELAYSPSLTQQHGYFHAGATGAIADSAAGYAAFTLMPEDSSVLTVEYKLNLVAPAVGERLIARSEVLKNGKTLKVCETKVFAVAKGKTEPVLCAVMLATIMAMSGKADR